MKAASERNLLSCPPTSRAWIITQDRADHTMEPDKRPCNWSVWWGRPWLWLFLCRQLVACLTDYICKWFGKPPSMEDGERVSYYTTWTPLMIIDTHGAQICPRVICTLLNLQWTHSGNDKAHYHNYCTSTVWLSTIVDPAWGLERQHFLSVAAGYY